MKQILLVLSLMLIMSNLLSQYSCTEVFSDDFSGGLSNWDNMYPSDPNSTWMINTSSQLYGNYNVSCGSLSCPQADLILKDPLQIADHWRASIDFYKVTSYPGYEQSYAMFSFWQNSNNKFLIGIGNGGASPAPSMQNTIRVGVKKRQSMWGLTEVSTFNFSWNLEAANNATIEKHGNVYSIYVNGIFITDYVDTFLNGTGKLGFHTYGATRLDNFVLESCINSSNQGLIAYYPFNNNANDESGNGNDGSLYGPTLTTDRFGVTNSAYEFDGIDDWIDIPDINPNLLTVSCWVQQYDNGNYAYVGGWKDGETYLLNKGIASPTDSYSFWINPNPTPEKKVYSTTIYEPGEWVFLTGTWDGQIMKIYVNGEFESQFSYSSFQPTLNAADVMIGRFRPSSWSYMNGKLDDIRIYNEVLGQDSILNLFHEGNWPIINCDLQVDAGNCQTRYLGYEPFDLGNYLIASASGGSGPYSYSWTPTSSITSSNNETAIVFPAIPTIYNVVVTDQNGCEATDEVFVDVIDISTVCPGNNKVQVCQVPQGNPTNVHEICISENAVPAHLANGSHLGPCNNPCLEDLNPNKSGTQEFIISYESPLEIYPNPTTGEFIIEYHFHDTQLPIFKLFDITGNEIAVDPNFEGSNNRIYVNSKLPVGIYIVKIITQTSIQSSNIIIVR